MKKILIIYFGVLVLLLLFMWRGFVSGYNLANQQNAMVQGVAASYGLHPCPSGAPGNSGEGLCGSTSTACDQDSFWMQGKCEPLCSPGYYHVHEANDQCMTVQGIAAWQNSLAPQPTSTVSLFNCQFDLNVKEKVLRISDNSLTEPCTAYIPPTEWITIGTSTPQQNRYAPFFVPFIVDQPTTTDVTVTDLHCLYSDTGYCQLPQAPTLQVKTWSCSASDLPQSRLLSSRWTVNAAVAPFPDCTLLQ